MRVPIPMHSLVDESWTFSCSLLFMFSSTTNGLPMACKASVGAIAADGKPVDESWIDLACRELVEEAPFLTPRDELPAGGLIDHSRAELVLMRRWVPFINQLAGLTRQGIAIWLNAMNSAASKPAPAVKEQASACASSAESVKQKRRRLRN